MDDESLCFTTASDLIALYAAKSVSPVEVVDAVLARIDSLEPRLNAFAARADESARANAQTAETLMMKGELSALTGVPVTIKDLTSTRDLPTRRGSRIALPATTVDAPVVSRLTGAGAIVLGKTTTPEFGWKGVSQSPLTGITSNPWKDLYNAGASSAGAGVGAAAGYGPLHQGSDGAGSIRMPAHFCGVFGLKPTFGRVPNVPVPNNDQASHVGPITRTVMDAALMLKVMAGPHPEDHFSLESAPADYPALLNSEVRGLKVAFSTDLGHARVDSEVAGLVKKAVQVFVELGCHVEEVNPTWGKSGPELGRFFWTTHEAHLALHLSEWEQQMDPGLVACIRDGLGRSADEYLKARADKITYIGQIASFFETWDLLLTPAVSVAAFPADRLQPEHWPQHPWDWLSWAEFSYPFNMSGAPAASIPCGFTGEGLPVGLQIVAGRFKDLQVLQAAAAFEEAKPWELVNSRL